MLAAMKGDTDYEKLNFLFWKSRDKKFVLQDRDTSDRVDVAVDTVLWIHPSTFQTGWVLWTNSIPNFVQDEVTGVDGPDPTAEGVTEKDKRYKRYFNVTTTVEGERRQFSGEGVTNMSLMADLLNVVTSKAGLSLADIEAGALNRIQDFTTKYTGVKEFDSKAGRLGKPVFAEVTLVGFSENSAPTAGAPSAPQGDDLEDEVPF